MKRNPFPGPRPYSADDCDCFYGRKSLAEELANRVLSQPCTMVFGPSGAGKSSLMQASVIPEMRKKYDYRVVRIDAWPDGEAPLSWLVRELFVNLDLGVPPTSKDTLEALEEALSLAELRSERPILIYLDQLEQLLFQGRKEAEAKALIEGLDRLANRPLRGLTVVLSLREDYLGRLRDRAQGRPELLEHEFRVPPLSVGELVDSVCLAAANGEPAQLWDKAEIRRLMREVRVPGEAESDEAEVQAAFGQIVCRALWEQTGAVGRRDTKAAEAILHRYLEATMEGLGPLRDKARQLLENDLIDDKGNRSILTEARARTALPGSEFDLVEVLGRAAILHSEAHQGSKYFEIGHDWLARRVFEQKQEREREEERKWIKRIHRWRRSYPFAAAFVGGVVLFVVAMTVAAFSVAADQESDRRADLLTNNVHMAGAVAGAVNSRLKDYRDDITHAATDFPSDLAETLRRSDPHPLNKGPLHDYCEQIYRRYNTRSHGKSPVDTWFLFDKDGIYRARSQDREGEAIGGDYSWRDYFRGARKLASDKVRSAYVSFAFISKATNTERFSIAAPIYDAEGEWIGVISATADSGATLGSLSLHDRNDNRIIALAAPQDKENPKDELPSDYVILVHPHLERGARTPLANAWVKELFDSPEQSFPQKGLEQLRMADADVAKPVPNYIDPVKSDYEGRWLAGIARVGHTGFAVIVQSREQEARDFGARLLDRLAKAAGPAAVPGLVLLLAAAWYERQKKARARDTSAG